MTIIEVMAKKKPFTLVYDAEIVKHFDAIEDDDELESLLLAHSTKLRAILDAAERHIEDGAGVNHEEFWKQVETRDQARKENGNARSKRKPPRDTPKRR